MNHVCAGARRAGISKNVVLSSEPRRTRMSPRPSEPSLVPPNRRTLDGPSSEPHHASPSTWGPQSSYRSVEYAWPYTEKWPMALVATKTSSGGS
eukprot:scaffold158230_cov23-Tisochrysis_lutea.AAC.2